MRIVRLLAAAAVASALVVSTGSPAWAHNALAEASPAKNSTLKKAPGEVRLTFVQRVGAKAVSIEVTDASGQRVPAEEPGAEGKVATLALTEPLANGTYTVTYRVVSLEDGHPVQGSYRFTVDDPSASPSPSAEPSTAEPSAAEPSTAGPSSAAPATVPTAAAADGPGWWPVAAGIAVIVLLIAGAFVVMRRRARM
ncbi:MAG TPA: copper resistance CopC family protein [Actinoplanes sp.]|nr:copper resistance CopC family protein [Actinoplanes sp.]